MTYRRGDYVEAARSLGWLDGVDRGEVGEIKSVGLFGHYTVDFYEGRVIRDVRESDLVPARSGPLADSSGWWLAKRPTGSPPKIASRRRSSNLGLRLVLAGILLAVMIYGLAQYLN